MSYTNTLCIMLAYIIPYVMLPGLFLSTDGFEWIQLVVTVNMLLQFMSH